MPDRDNFISHLRHADSSFQQYWRGWQRDDLEQAIRHYRLASQMIAFDHPQIPVIQSSLCEALLQYWDLWGGDEIIDEAVQLGEESLRLSLMPGVGLVRRYSVCVLALCWKSRSSQESCLGRAEELFEAMKTLEPDEFRVNPDYIMVSSAVFEGRYGASGNLEQLEEAIALCNTALSSIQDDNPRKPQYLAFLSHNYMKRFARLQDASQLSEWLRVAEEAVKSCLPSDPRMPRYLNCLAFAFRGQWHHRKDPQLLHQYISYHEKALECTQIGDRHHSLTLSYIAVGLQLRYSITGDSADVEATISISETALNMNQYGEGSDYMAHVLCIALISRFKDTGSFRDIDSAVDQMRQRLSKETDYMGSALLLHILSSALLERYYCFGFLPDLKESLQMCIEASQAVPANASYLFNVGACYLALYQHEEDLSDLKMAIHYMERADQKRDTMSAEVLGQYHLHYGSALVAQARVSQTTLAWMEGVQQLRYGVEHAPDGHPTKTDAIIKLGRALQARFGALGKRRDLEESHGILRDCLDMHGNGFQRTKCSTAFGEALVLYHKVSGVEDHLILALEYFKKASEDSQGLIRDRFQAAMEWARISRELHLWEKVYQAYCLAIELLPRLAWLGHGRTFRLNELQVHAATLASDAAAAAIEVGQIEKSVELLEAGRGIFWSQLLQLRTEAHNLDEVASDLAKELRAVGKALELDIASASEIHEEQLLQRQRRLAERWDQLVDDVRKLPGFDTFLKPATIGDLIASAAEGPVIIFNSSAIRCDALIMLPGRRIHHCPLPGMTAEMASRLSRFLGHAYTAAKDHGGVRFIEGALATVLDRLWRAVGEPVWHALTNHCPEAMHGRIWLCPTGAFCLLPLHAAMPYDPSGLGFPNSVMCSYTATLSSLIRARNTNGHTDFARPRLLAVSQPETPGHKPLAGSIRELKVIRRIDLGDCTTLIGAEASVSAVCEAMTTHNWVHFSCHGSLNALHPLESCFHFEDGPLSLSRISELRLPHADFAFLSACHTARGYGSLPDESLHVAAALQLTGYKSVIATQWAIADEDAPLVADVVYKHMAVDGGGDYSRAAVGLHKAVQALRRRGIPAARWAPFIHIGV